jgi:hypothetical protein
MYPEPGAPVLGPKGAIKVVPTVKRVGRSQEKNETETRATIKSVRFFFIGFIFVKLE